MSANPQPIPFLDLITPHRELEEQLVEVFRKALSTAGFIGGPMVEEFEQSFASFCGTKYCVGVGSGTDAVRFALIAAGVEPGDIVVTVPNTFIATTEAISQAGALPNFVDVNEVTSSMDPEQLREYLETQCQWDTQTGHLRHRATEKRVRAIVPVHLYGQPSDMDSILELAERYNLIVVEDSCQAHGARYFSKQLGVWQCSGSMGNAGAFSFYPGKNLGACGEAGAVTTNDETIAHKVRMLRDHGQVKKYYHDLEGYNGRLDAVQAGILSVKLRHLREWNKKRQSNAKYYSQMLEELSPYLITFTEPPWADSVYHLYVVRLQNRDCVREQLANANIGTGIHYPIPLHLQQPYADQGLQGKLPISEALSKQILSLPMYPQLQREQQDRVFEVLQRHCETESRSGGKLTAAA